MRHRIMAQREYKSFADFWPYYLSEHRQPATRLLHGLGTLLAIAFIVFVIAAGRWWLFPLGLIPGYGFAWISHFFIEKNRPATFSYPLWSLRADFRMWWKIVSGTMQAEVDRVVAATSDRGSQEARNEAPTSVRNDAVN